jgi:hypothetical protein
LPSTPAAAAAAGDAVGVSAAEAQAASVAPAPAEPAPAEPVEQVENSANLVTINFADGSYIPTNAMADNARRALAIREKKPMSQRGMTSVGIARARDIMNKRPMSEDTVRRMKAFFDRHEVDKQGETWKDEGKGFQAWYGWGGDAGYAWATAIVERLNKAETKQANSAPVDARIEFDVRSVASDPARSEKKMSATDWIEAITHFRRDVNDRVAESAKPIINGRSIIELAKKEYELPTPNADEDHGDFMTRCMADPVSTAEFPDAEQRTAVCMKQHEGHFAKVGKRGAIVASDKAPKGGTPNKTPTGEGSAKGDASGKGAEVTAEQEATLQNKADEFNAKESNTRNGRATLGQLKSVFQRGLGAFNVSHSPVVKTASQWAFARVNAFLYLLKTGRPENPKYVTDNDLLPKNHPKAGK